VPGKENTAPCCLPPTQIDLANGGRAFDLFLCVGAAHRSARAITPTMNSTDAKATVSASSESFSISDLYIVSPGIGRIPTGATVREGQGDIGAQTRLLWQFAWANSRRICVGHNCAINDALARHLGKGICRSLARAAHRMFGLASVT
jgi:hypothetical protein